MTGFGGSNAAVLLEDYPGDVARPSFDPTDGETRTSPPRLFVLSAKSDASLLAQAAKFADHFQGAIQNPNLLHDLSYTLGQRRTQFSDRLTVTASSLPDLHRQLSDPGLCTRGRLRSHTVAFVFTGQGAQYHQMGAELSRYEVFAQTLTNADELLARFGAGWSLTGSKA